MKWIDDFVSLIYPRLCCTCARHLLKEEKFLCFICLNDLPYTGFIEMPQNPVQDIFYSRVKVNRAASYLEFEKGNKTQLILHELKYRSNPEIGNYFGEIIGSEMKDSSLYNDIDAIIPVPIHKSKLESRGYNQSEYIADGISKATNIQVIDREVIRVKNSVSQTKKGRYERWENVQSIFRLKPDRIKSAKHLLLVDDVVTTGATLESLSKCLNSYKKFEISILTLARSG